MKKFMLAGLFTSALISSASASQQFPGIGLDTGGPAMIITLGAGGSETISATGQPANFSDGDDTYIGVINNSGVTVNSINLAANTDIFAFDGDGILSVASQYGNTDSAAYGYGGLGVTFSNINYDTFSSGTVNFTGGLANGGTAYFSLEDVLQPTSFTGPNAPTVTTGVPEPSTWAMMLAGFAALGFASYRKNNKRPELAA